MVPPLNLYSDTKSYQLRSTIYLSHPPITQVDSPSSALTSPLDLCASKLKQIRSVTLFPDYTIIPLCLFSDLKISGHFSMGELS